MQFFVKSIIMLMKLHYDQYIMLSSNHTFHMFALPGVKISNIIIELASYKGKLWELFFSLILMNTPPPLFSKAKILKFIDFIQMENCIFVNKSVSDSLHPLFSQVYYLQMITKTTTLHLHQIGLLKIPTNGTSIYGTKSF